MDHRVKFRLGADVFVGIGDLIGIGNKTYRVLMDSDEVFDLQQHDDDADSDWKSVIQTYHHGRILEILRHVIEDAGLRSVRIASVKVEGEKETCAWTYTDSEGYYDTACGKAFVFNYHPVEPQFVWCPYCGKSIAWKTEAGTETEAESDLGWI